MQRTGDEEFSEASGLVVGGELSIGCGSIGILTGLATTDMESKATRAVENILK